MWASCVQMLPYVRQAAIEPLIKAAIQPETLVCTDGYAIYNRF